MAYTKRETQPTGDNDNSLATTAFVQQELDANQGIQTATQTALVSSVAAPAVDITGCSLSLTAGKYILVASFNNARYWTSSVGGVFYGGETYGAITDASNNVIEFNVETLTSYAAYVQRAEAGFTVVTTVEPSVTTTYKMRGYCGALAAWTNFASGFRGDSGYGNLCEFTAIKVGL